MENNDNSGTIPGTTIQPKNITPITTTTAPQQQLLIPKRRWKHEILNITNNSNTKTKATTTNTNRKMKKSKNITAKILVTIRTRITTKGSRSEKGEKLLFRSISHHTCQLCYLGRVFLSAWKGQMMPANRAWETVSVSSSSLWHQCHQQPQGAMCDVTSTGGQCYPVAAGF